MKWIAVMLFKKYMAVRQSPPRQWQRSFCELQIIFPNVKLPKQSSLTISTSPSVLWCSFIMVFGHTARNSTKAHTSIPMGGISELMSYPADWRSVPQLCNTRRLVRITQIPFLQSCFIVKGAEKSAQQKSQYSINHIYEKSCGNRCLPSRPLSIKRNDSFKKLSFLSCFIFFSQVQLDIPDKSSFWPPFSFIDFADNIKINFGLSFIG